MRLPDCNGKLQKDSATEKSTESTGKKVSVFSVFPSMAEQGLPF
jgi:hypothetical protein